MVSTGVVWVALWSQSEWVDVRQKCIHELQKQCIPPMNSSTCGKYWLTSNPWRIWKPFNAKIQSNLRESRYYNDIHLCIRHIFCNCLVLDGFYRPRGGSAISPLLHYPTASILSRATAYHYTALYYSCKKRETTCREWEETQNRKSIGDSGLTFAEVCS